MSDWTPATPYTPGDVVLGPAPAIRSRLPERILLAAVAAAPAIVAAGYAWPVRAVLSQTEVASMFALAASGVLLAIGCHLIGDWRRKRDESEDEREALSMSELTETEKANWNECFEHRNRTLIAALAQPVTVASGALSTGFEDIDPLDELERHLTDALAVLLREPSLKIDPSTIRMLTKFKGTRPVARDEKGRWRSLQ